MSAPARGDTGTTYRILSGVSRVTGTAADMVGHVAAGVMLLLAASVTLGITLRWIGIDNSWTYDLDTFTLIWLAFLGAAFTALRKGHVTSGIALENAFSGRGVTVALALLRFVIVVGFLSVFVMSSYDQAYSSFSNHETTLDIVQWPVWVAKAALPLGALTWLVAEIHKFCETMIARE